MRYTTIIDLREWPQAYRNINIRLVYYHLAMVAGYHDYNRDVTEISVRSLAADTGCTISAVRHALHILEALQLIKRKGRATYVRKWLTTPKTTPRKQSNTAAGGTIQETPTEKKINGLQQLKERAAAGDLRAQELIAKFGKS